MSLRARFALSFAAIGAVVAVLVGVLSFHAASSRITDEIDRSLASVTVSLQSGQTGVLAPVAAVGPDGARDRRDGEDGDGGDGDGDGSGGDGDGPRGVQQRLVGRSIAADGSVTLLGGRTVALPPSGAALALAASGTAGQTDLVETEVGPTPYRVLTTALGNGRGALQVAVDVGETQEVLGGMALEIAFASGAVLVVAAAAGWLLARRITRRLTRLARVAESVSLDGAVDRDVEVPVEGRDEVGRLSASLNTMLVRLAASREAQDRLVQDAAHELRTPLTSLRTNASVLRRAAELSPEARERLVDDVQGETRELSNLVEELVELALSQRGTEADEPVDLGGVVRHAAARVERRTGRSVRIDGDGSVVRGRPQALERAVGNLLENAAKFDADGTDPIEVRIRRGTTSVSDRGPGIGGADAQRVFDRFYRADSARGLPGSGLGLAIVRDVAESHGGAPFTDTPAAGGATVGFTVGAERLLPADDPAEETARALPG